MRALLDEDVHIKLLRWLKDQGHDATRVPTGLKNGQVIYLARRERRVLITRDKDFANRIMYPPTNSLGIVILRIHPPLLDNLVAALNRLLSELPETEFAGKLIIVEAHGFHLAS